MKIVNNTDKRVFITYKPDNGDRITVIQLFPKDSEKANEFEIENTDTLCIHTIKEVDE